jgi:hypothetical protein
LTQLTPKKDWQEIFLSRLRKSPNVAAAARAAGYTRQWMYELRERDEAFAKAWDEALAEALDVAEGELYRRSVRGVVKRVYYKDEHIDTIREYSDTLLIFMLKSHRPEKYRETTNTNITGTLKTDSKVTHAIEPDTAINIFDILAEAGVFESDADDAKTDQVHPASADA